jgi:hypothetical protein
MYAPCRESASCDFGRKRFSHCGAGGLWSNHLARAEIWCECRLSTPESAILGSATGQSCALVDLASSDGVTAASRPSRPHWNGAVRPSLCANQSRSRRSACPVYYPHERDAAPSALLPKVAFNSGRNSCPDYFFDRAGDYVALVGVIQVNFVASKYDYAKKVGRALVGKHQLHRCCTIRVDVVDPREVSGYRLPA